MIIEKFNIKSRLKLKLLALALALPVFSLKAQTLVTAPMTSTPAAGSYYGTSSITLSPGFSASGATGTYQFYILNDCIPLTTAPTAGMNYIMTSVPRMPAYVPGTAGYTSCNVMQTLQYIDGLGRPVQTVQVKGSPQGNDMVQPIAYDAYGREATKYLPYALTGTATSDGSYKSDALTANAGQAHFYTSPPTGVSPITTPQAVTAFEPSPLNRVVEQGSPGDAWQLTGTVNPSGIVAGHTVKTIYANNDGTQYWANQYSVNIDAAGNRTLIFQNRYGTNTLLVTISQDENWNAAQSDSRLNTAEEYKDKQGHIVLKRTYNYNTATSTLETLSTYYVYDDLGNLAFVLPPAAGADATAGITSAANQTTLNNLCYQYSYDERDRLTQKKIPGKGWEYMVYNRLDQLVLSQDANQRAGNQWTVTKYDAQGRVIVTGLWNAGSAINLATLQSSIYAAVQWDTRDYTNTTATNPTGYVISSYPQLSTVLKINYYDDYTFPAKPSTVTTPSGASTNTTGLLTATVTGVLNSSDMLWTAHYYDDFGRLTQSYAQHYLGGVSSPYNYDVVTNTYDFTDFVNELVSVTRLHYGKITTNTAAVLNATITNTYVYDHIGHKKQTLESINGGANILLSQNNYNEIGQLMVKQLHSTSNGSSFLQNTSYTYNERGWLLKINDPTVAPSSTQLFAEQLQYNNVTAVPNISPTPQYNGNIASQTWWAMTNPVTTAAKSYTYSYDNLNRLTGGISTDNFTETGINYDLNGNITKLNRYMGSSTTALDQLTYTYNGTNQVQSINDAAVDNSLYGYRPGTYSGYQYDPNGNMKVLPTPPNGSAVANINIQYNLLNLPWNITGGKTITYTYDADGEKLRRVSPNTGSTDYINGIQYDQGVGATVPAISFIQTEEGKAVPDGAGGYNYTYYLGDQLGNTRLTFDTKTGVAVMSQQDDYYPFGYEISRGTVTNPKNEYLYNKKELQEELQQYDYGARFYDPVIATWTTIDPSAERYFALSPYNYVADNPIKLIDPDGNDIINPQHMVLSNTMLIRKMHQFDLAVARISGRNIHSYKFIITGGDRYKKNGDIYSATNNNIIRKAARHSRHLQEEGAIAVDLSTIKGIDDDVLKAAAAETGFRFNPDGADYDDGHFHIDLDINHKSGKRSKYASEYLDDDDDIDKDHKPTDEELNKNVIAEQQILKEALSGNTSMTEALFGQIMDDWYRFMIRVKQQNQENQKILDELKKKANDKDNN